jgi:hypothetical protein
MDPRTAPLADEEPDEIVRGLAWLAEELTDELERRVDRLETISTPSPAKQSA